MNTAYSTPQTEASNRDENQERNRTKPMPSIPPTHGESSDKVFNTRGPSLTTSVLLMFLLLGFFPLTLLKEPLLSHDILPVTLTVLNSFSSKVGKLWK